MYFSFPILPLYFPQSLRLHFLGKEAVVTDTKGSMAGRNAARGSSGDLTDCRHRHTCHYRRHPDIHGPQGMYLSN